MIPSLHRWEGVCAEIAQTPWSDDNSFTFGDSPQKYEIFILINRNSLFPSIFNSPPITTWITSKIQGYVKISFSSLSKTSIHQANQREEFRKVPLRHKRNKCDQELLKVTTRETGKN